jgi:hypothetical protein
VRVVEAELHLAAAGGFLTQAAVRADFVEVEVFVLADATGWNRDSMIVGVFRWFSVARLSNGSNEFEATM